MKVAAAWHDARRLMAGVFSRRVPTQGGQVVIGERPIAVQYTPGSLLSQPTSHAHRAIGARGRLATCSSVAWFHGLHLATVNLLGETFHSYVFDPASRTLALLQTISAPAGAARPEHLAFSRDGRLLAISSANEGSVALYRVNRETHLVECSPAAIVQVDGDVNAHGVAFSPCARFLAYTTVDRPGVVRLCRVHDTAPSGPLRIEPLQALANPLAPLKPKSVAFSPDGRFVAVCHAPNAGSSVRHQGRIDVHRFSETDGIEPPAVSSGTRGLRLGKPDGMGFLPNGRHLALANQENDTVTIVGFDPATGALGRCQALFANPAAGLNFPHACDASGDGRYLAVANYGDDKLTVYSIA